MQPPYGGYGQPPGGGGYGGPPGQGGYGPPPGGYGQPPGGYGAPPPYGPPLQPVPPQPPQRNSALVVFLIVLGVIAVFGLGTCGLIFGLSMQPTKKSPASAYVFCEGSPGNGFNCMVTHTAGTAAANTCWDIRVPCANGVVVTGHACQTVAVGSKSTHIMAPSELRNSTACSRLTSVTVENVTVNGQ